MSGVGLYLPSLFACGLGVWQVQRLQWKTTEIDKRQTILSDQPRDIQNTYKVIEGNDLPQVHTPVLCKGKLLHEKSIFVGPRVRSELGQTFLGHQLITPLRLEGGENSKNGVQHEILVLRGWVPDLWKQDPSRFSSMQPKDTVTVKGLVRHTDAPGMFAPENRPEHGEWFYYDAVAMNTFCGLKGSKPILVEALDIEDVKETKKVKLSTAMDVLAFRTDRNQFKHKGGSDSKENAQAPDKEIQNLLGKLNASTLPIQRTLGDFMRFNVTPQDHINYAATWFTLAFVTAGMATFRLRSPKARRRIF